MKTKMTRINVAIMALAILIMLPVAALAHPADVTISGPTNNSTIVVDALPVNVTVSGVVLHATGNVNDMRACASVDDGSPVCGDYFHGTRNPSSFNYSIPVEIYDAGTHTIRVSADKSGGGHYGFAEITVTIVVTSATCDEIDPPAWANQYLNSLDLPQSYNQIRGQIINFIAQNMNAGRYGTCTYNYDLVKSDVDTKLYDLTH